MKTKSKLYGVPRLNILLLEVNVHKILSILTYVFQKSNAKFVHNFLLHISGDHSNFFLNFDF